MVHESERRRSVVVAVAVAVVLIAGLAPRDVGQVCRGVETSNAHRARAVQLQLWLLLLSLLLEGPTPEPFLLPHRRLRGARRRLGAALDGSRHHGHRAVHAEARGGGGGGEG